MNQSFETLLSAYLDEEISETDFKQLQQYLAQNPQAGEQLHRYALISESIKGQSQQLSAACIASRVSTALQDEPVVLAPQSRRRQPVSPFKRQLAAVAIAASVATIAILNVGSLLQDDSSPGNFPVTAGVSAPSASSLADLSFQPVSSGSLVAAKSQQPATQWKTLSNHPEVEEELNQLLMDHSEYTHEAGVPGLLPYATIVVYDK